MSFWVYFGMYTLSIIIIWGFFLIAKIHSLKFKNYQPKIIGLTNILTIALVIMSIIGYLLIFIFLSYLDTYEVKSNVESKGIIDLSADNSESNKTVGEDYY